METTVLEMFFLDELGGTIKLSVEDPDEYLVPTQVQTAMQTILAQEVLVGRTGKAVSIKGAQLVTKTISDMELD